MLNPSQFTPEVPQMKNIKIQLLEERPEDAWFDLSLRELRAGEVRFYRADDLLTGQWLFKVCKDPDGNRSMVKAIKCPPGKLFSQLEGSTMLFQKAKSDSDYYYDIISITQVDGEGRLKRDVLNTLEQIPAAIKESFDVKTYEEVTGKKLPGKNLVTLSKADNEKQMITLFILERARTLPVSERQAALDLLPIVKKLQKTSVTEVHNVTSETFGIDRATLDKMLGDLEAKGKIKRLDEGYVRVA
jgi:hypothetical protein